MDTLPKELRQLPLPVISFLGLHPATSRLIESVTLANKRSGAIRCNFVQLPLEHEFPVKKEIRERTSSFAVRSEKDFDGVIPTGILKSNWMRKHQELLPAVCVLLYEFNAHLNDEDWTIQETVIANEIDRLKQSLSGNLKL